MRFPWVRTSHFLGPRPREFQPSRGVCISESVVCASDMNPERILRSKSKQPVDSIKNKSIKTSTKALASPAATSASTANKKEIKTGASCSSLTSTSRLSTSNRSTTAPVTPKDSLLNRLTALESRLVTVETSFERLAAENTDLRETISNLKLELQQLKSRNEPRVPVQASDQQEINSNIIIRGVDVSANTTTSELAKVYEGVRNHLEISELPEFDPISISLLPSNAARPNASCRPIKITLSSVAAKVKFLQVRRIKKDICQSDIGINNNSRRPLLITEHLTRTNQELLFQARSLREGGNCKFVWSKNGEIFARFKPNSKVIKISDTLQVNQLRAELNLEPLSNHGRLLPSTTQQPVASSKTIWWIDHYSNRKWPTFHALEH